MRFASYFIFFILLSSFVNAQTLVPIGALTSGDLTTPPDNTAAKMENDPKLNEAIKTCIDKKELASCLTAVPRLNFEKQYALAFKTGEILCELDPTNCYSVYNTALKLEKKKTEDFLIKITTECGKNADYCDSLASIQEDQKNYEQALINSKKYYTKHKKGQYILFANKYGNKQDSYDASLADCKNNTDQCVFYLRYFYEHPQKDEILKLSVKNCEEQKNLSEGASNCAILGTYYFKIQEFDLAYKHWSKDCETNNLSCVLILGSKRYSDDINRSTLKKFCTVKTGIANSYNLQLTECEKINDDTVRVPPVIEKYAVDQLKIFLNEQKLSN